MSTYRPAAAGINATLDKLLADQSLSRIDRREAMREIVATAERMGRVLDQCIAAEQEAAFA